MSFSRRSGKGAALVRTFCRQYETVGKFREDFNLKDDKLWNDIMGAARRIIEEEGLSQYVGKQRYWGWKRLDVAARRSACLKVS